MTDLNKVKEVRMNIKFNHEADDFFTAMGLTDGDIEKFKQMQNRLKIEEMLPLMGSGVKPGKLLEYMYERYKDAPKEYLIMKIFIELVKSHEKRIQSPKSIGDLGKDLMKMLEDKADERVHNCKECRAIKECPLPQAKKFREQDNG